MKLRARYDGSAGLWEAASSVVVTGDAPPVVVVPDPTAEPEPPTSEQQQADPPAAPTGLTASQVAHDSVTLRWAAPSSGSTVTGYRVLRGTDANSLSAIAQDTGNAGAEYTDSTVAAETTYYYAVLALSPDGDGAQSAALSVTTQAAPGSKKGENKPPNNRVTRAAPGVPLNLTAVAGDTKLTFSWDPPASDGGSAIVRYNYEFGPTGGTLVDENHGTDPTGSQTLRKTGLINGTGYTFKLRAVNRSGGSVTTGAYVTVTGTPQANSPATAPMGIVGPIRVPGTVSWDFNRPEDSDGIAQSDGAFFSLMGGYEFQWLRVDGATETAITGATSPEYTLTSADVGKKLKLRLRFEDDRGNAESLMGAAFPSGETIQDTAACPAPTYTGGAVQLWTSNITPYFDRDFEDYGFRDGVNFDYGALDDSTITTEYTINRFQQHKSGATNEIRLDLNRRLAAADEKRFTLYVCDTQLRIADATYSSSDHRYTWDNASDRVDLHKHGVRTLYASRDTTAPAFASAEANGASLVITFDEDLAAAASLANSAFTVKKTPSGGSEATVTLSTTTGPVISGKTVTLTLATALVSTDTAVKVAYTKPSTGTANKLVDAAANETATFTDQPVTNNTPALPVITIAAGASGIASTSPLEGDNAWFTLSRTGSTTAALTVNVTVSETGGDRVAAANEGAMTVTFTANSATVPLTVATVDNSVDQANSTVTMTVTASRATYTVGTPASATVTVQDDDTRGVTVSAATLTVNEGSTGTYTVKLDSQPTASVTVTPSKTGSSDVTFAPASLTFSTSNWRAPQTVTVTAAQDTDAVDDSATISHAVAGADYGTHSVSAGSVTVTVRDDETGGNNLPTSRSGTVTATEDTAFTLSASNFAFFDGDSGDTLASVKITALPAAGKGTLALDGTAITSSALPKTVTKADLDASKLKYTPPANEYGTPYTRFKFKVNDGTADSAAAYTMIINVTNVNDVPTGRPTISGSILVGSTLTASTNDIIDPDGLPNSFTYQWKRFAANGITFEQNIGTNSRTYRLTDSDQGKRVKAEVSFTDNGGTREGPLLSAATATVQRPSSGSLSVGGLGAYWYGNHDNGGNLLKVDSCSGLKRFRVIWAGPEGNRRADEWDAEITARGGSSAVSQNFRETPGNPGYFELYGGMRLAGPDTISVRVRGRFGSTWGTWSPTATLHCVEIEN